MISRKKIYSYFQINENPQLSNPNIKNKAEILNQIKAKKKHIEVIYKEHILWVNNEEAALYHIDNSIDKIEKLAKESIAMFVRNADDNIICMDIGANTGLYSYFINFFEPKTKLFVFEPDSSLIECIKLNLSKCANASINNIGIADYSGALDLFVNEKSRQTNSFEWDAVSPFADECKKVSVRVESIDNFCEKNDIPKIDILKIDVQGYEHKILQGAETMLKKLQILALEASFISKDTIKSLSLADEYFKEYKPINQVMFGADLIFYNSVKVLKKQD